MPSVVRLIFSCSASGDLGEYRLLQSLHFLQYLAWTPWLGLAQISPGGTIYTFMGKLLDEAGGCCFLLNYTSWNVFFLCWFKNNIISWWEIQRCSWGIAMSPPFCLIVSFCAAVWEWSVQSLALPKCIGYLLECWNEQILLWREKQLNQL